MPIDDDQKKPELRPEEKAGARLMVFGNRLMIIGVAVQLLRATTSGRVSPEALAKAETVVNLLFLVGLSALLVGYGKRPR